MPGGFKGSAQFLGELTIVLALTEEGSDAQAAVRRG